MNNSLTFDDLEVGDSWKSKGRTITETDVVNFAGMSGDYDPLHVDHEHAKETPFGKPIAHGLLGLSFVAGLGSHSPSVQTIAFVAIREWEFMRPAYIGDTVHVRTVVAELNANGRRTGKVIWTRSLVNQDGEVIQTGSFETLVSRRLETRMRVDGAESPKKSHVPPAVPAEKLPN